MEIVIADNAHELGVRAARWGAECLRRALQEKPEVTILVATGASQFATLSALVQSPGIDWSRVTAFHLDEYIGLSIDHPASFRRYLHERFVSQVPLKQFHDVQADAPDPHGECARLAALIAPREIDVAFIGIGENAHLAFNDPPADFETTQPYLVVQLDQACRQQQLGEGWFPTLDAVPTHAISMSVAQILKARHIVCSVPDARKAWAVQHSVEGPVTAEVPASILQKHLSCQLFLDPPAAGLLQQQGLSQLIDAEASR